jgi:plastocyanin
MPTSSLCRQFLGTVLICSGLCFAQDVNLTGRVTFISPNQQAKTRDADKVVLWLTPIAGTAPTPAVPAVPHPRLTQKNKSFDPHVLIVPVGSIVDFPNRDPFFHNVFSLFDGKRFDLGLYEAGSTREVRFDKPGISYIFCNIHAQMSAVVIALDTSYYTVSDAHGEVVISNVPAGRYLLHVWYEGAPPERLRTLTREITVSEELSTLGVLRLTEVPLPRTHRNKYDREYEPSAPIDSPGYQQP